MSPEFLVGTPIFLDLSGTEAPRHYEQSSDTWALFGQATWNITDSLRATLGARYTQEDKDGERSIDIASIGSTVTPFPIAAFGAPDVETNQGTGHDLKGAIKHFFLIGGCDGAKPGRNYFTEFAEQAPDDTVILTLGCGKFRFNKQNHGDIGGILLTLVAL